MFAYFIIYEQDGKTGNDFIKGNIQPYKWLIEAKQKYPKSHIAVKNFTQIDIPAHEFEYYNSLIGIDIDNKKEKVIKKRNIKEIPKEIVKEEYVEHVQEIAQQVADNKAIVKTPVVKQASRKVSNDSRKPSKGSNRQFYNTNE